MAGSTEDRTLFREAIDLAIRLQNDPANPVSADMVRAWVARSPQHAATWARVAEIHGMAGVTLSDGGRGRGRLNRRNLLAGGAAGVVAVAAGGLTLPQIVLRARADHVTAVAQIEKLGLPDGSAMTLGPGSAVAIGFTDTRRAIELLQGMAYFDVAADRDRPFVVTTGPVSATALGTSFDLSNDAGIVSSSVEHGRVEIDAATGLRETLVAGDWIAFDTAAGTTTRGEREIFQIAAWRDGMIVADREAVAAMVAKIARWLPGRVVIADPAIGSRTVSGVFDLTDPQRALDAVVRPFGARVRRVADLLTVISPV